MHPHLQDEKRRMAQEEEPDGDDDLELFLQDQADLAVIFGGPDGPCDVDEWTGEDDWPEPIDPNDFPE